MNCLRYISKLATAQLNAIKCQSGDTFKLGMRVVCASLMPNNNDYYSNGGKITIQPIGVYKLH